MNIALVDDLETDRARLNRTLNDYAAARGLDLDISVFSSGEALLAGYRPLTYTIIFLDIYMDGMTGIETAQQIRAVDDDTILVFLTTSGDQQAAAIHWHVYDYLPKPVQSEAIFEVMDHILRQKAAEVTDRFSFSYERRNCSLSYQDILSVQADGNNLFIQAVDGETYAPRMTYTAAKEQLMQDGRFLEITRGVIVNMDHILEFSGSSCILRGDKRLPISVRNSKKVIHVWQNFLFAQVRGGKAHV